MYVYGWGGGSVCMWHRFMWKLEDNLWEMVLSFYHVVSQNPIQVIQASHQALLPTEPAQKPPSPYELEFILMTSSNLIMPIQTRILGAWGKLQKWPHAKVIG